MLTLRPYQELIVNGVRDAYIQGFKAPLAVAPTGAGKTVIFSYIAANSNARGKRVMILVHRVELLRQTSEKLTEMGVDHGLINPLYTPAAYKSVQVASVQTLIRRLNKHHPPDLIIVDEAHHATAGTWRKIIETYPKARVLGVTATPCRGDGKGLGAHAGGIFDTLVMGPQIKELIDGGFLVAPKVYAPLERIDLSGVATKMGDYEKHGLEMAVDKPKITGHAVEHYKQLCDGAPAVVFCVSIKHAQHVADEFRAAGYTAYAVDGSQDDDTRKRILQGLGNGRVQVVCSCDLISEGTDIPAIGCAILLRPTQSLGLYLQQVGRALRPSPGKPYAVILDHVGNVLMHGMPDDVRDWSLDGIERRKKGEKKEKTIRVEQCERCFMVYEPQPICPACGHQKVVKDAAPQQVDGTLREVTIADRVRLKKEKRQEVGRAKTREELEAIAKARGYKPGWVNHILRERERQALADKVASVMGEII
jgi:DNA repair protein RadD